MPTDNSPILSHILQQHGISHFGFSSLNEPLSLSIYESWLDQNYHGDMEYLKTHFPIKQSPQKKWPRAQSAIVLGFPYKNEHDPKDNPFPNLNIASYARGPDYHFTLKKIMGSLCEDLKKIFPDEEFLGFTDSSPILERDLAYRAGLGWFGKNSCIIDRQRGSFFFIAEVITSLELSNNVSLRSDHCGTCQRCIEACPTEAILPNRTLDATRCISYWTIESKTPASDAIKEKSGDLFFGCDICQDVCPWNLRIHKEPAPVRERQHTIEDLRWILESSHNQILKRVYGTPLARAGALGLKRNAVIVAANIHAQELRPVIQAYVDDAKIGKVAEWALLRLGT